MFNLMRCCLPVVMALLAVTAGAQSLADAVMLQAPRLKIPKLPVYPTAELAANAGSVVDLVLEVDVVGRPGGIKSMTSTPRNAAFEKAVADAATDWKFRPGQRNCIDANSVSQLKVTFAPGGETGSISVRDMDPPVDPETSIGPGALVAPNAGAARRSMRYPTRALRTGATGDVVVLFSVDPKNGKLVETSAISTSRPQGFEDDFIATALAVLGRIQFQPIPGKTEPVFGCTSFDFRFQ